MQFFRGVALERWRWQSPEKYLLQSIHGYMMNMKGMNIHPYILTIFNCKDSSMPFLFIRRLEGAALVTWYNIISCNCSAAHLLSLPELVLTFHRHVFLICAWEALHRWYWIPITSIYVDPVWLNYRSASTFTYVHRSDDSSDLQLLHQWWSNYHQNFQPKGSDSELQWIRKARITTFPESLIWFLQDTFHHMKHFREIRSRTGNKITIPNFWYCIVQALELIFVSSILNEFLEIH